MIKTLKKELKEFLSTLLHSTIVAIVIGIIGLPVLISWVTGTLDILIQTMQSPTPTWATIVVGLLLVVFYLNPKTDHSSSSPVDYETKYFPIGKFLWETKIYKNKNFEVINLPLCQEHDLRLVEYENTYFCPYHGPKGCDSELSYDLLDVVFKSAYSHIDKEVRKLK